MTAVAEVQKRLRESSFGSLIGLGGPIAAIVMALAVEALLLLAIGKNPWVAYGHLFRGSVGTVFGITETLVKATPLLLAGLGVAFAFKAGLFNIGAEGQIFVGSLAAAAVSLYVQGAPPVILITLAGLAGALAGGIWGGIPGWLRARLEVNEIIVTIMLNYVALNLVRYMVNVPMREKSGFYPKTDTFPADAWLPNLVADTRLHIGLLIALAAAVLIHYLIAHTTLGYRLRTVGANREAAEYAGIKVGGSFFLAMAISGSLAGIAGFVEVNGVHHRLLDKITTGYGYDAIAVALLGRTHPAGVVIAALFFGALRVGAISVQRNAGVPVAMIYILQGLVIFFILGSEVLNVLLKRKLRRGEARA